MRPKKCILLIDPDTDRRRRMVLVLETRGYRVIDAGPGEMLQAKNIAFFEGAMIFAGPEASTMSRKLQQAWPQSVILIFSSEQMRAGDPGLWFDTKLPMIDILERLRIAIMRKRGPKKKVSESFPPKALAFLQSGEEARATA